jgi:hypothetical protein
VEVERAGKYRITLRHQPEHTKRELVAVKARLKVGDEEHNAAVPAGVSGMAFVIDLKAGKTRLQTWLQEKDGATRGAFYVDVERLK